MDTIIGLGKKKTISIKKLPIDWFLNSGIILIKENHPIFFQEARLCEENKVLTL